MGRHESQNPQFGLREHLVSNEVIRGRWCPDTSGLLVQENQAAFLAVLVAVDAGCQLDLNKGALTPTYSHGGLDVAVQTPLGEGDRPTPVVVVLDARTPNCAEVFLAHAKEPTRRGIRRKSSAIGSAHHGSAR